MPETLIAREEALRNWLTALPCDAAWEVAPQLAEQWCHRRRSRRACAASSAPRKPAVTLQYFARYLRSTRSVDTLVNSTARIFDLISAIKAYSYMDRAAILEVDVPAGLDATVQMLQSRMSNVHVVRDYEPDLPRISAYGSELNQVWTALIENALEAHGRSGRRSTGCELDLPPGRRNDAGGDLGYRAAVSRPNCRTASSSPFSPPSRPARASASASTTPCALFASIAAISACAPSPDRPASASACRIDQFQAY